MRRPESVLVVVYTKTGLILIMQRADDPAFWQSVTGSLEPFETPLAAAKRELFEETGLDAGNLVDCHTTNQFAIREEWLHRYPPGTTHNTEHVFLAEFPSVVDVSLSPAEHLQFEWIGAAGAKSRLWSATNRQALEQFVLPALAG